MKKLILLTILLSGCGMATHQTTCVERGEMTVCDGFEFKTPLDGQQGSQGTDGTNGIDGQDGQRGPAGRDAIQQIIDPCAPGGEVLLLFSDGSVVAWYQDVGLYVIEEGVKYRTTDAEQCVFALYNGVFEDESGQTVGYK